MKLIVGVEMSYGMNPVSIPGSMRGWNESVRFESMDAKAGRKIRGGFEIGSRDGSEL